MFALPAEQGHAREGSSDKNPIRLSGITAFDFQSFLKVIFPRCVAYPCRYDQRNSRYESTGLISPDRPLTETTTLTLEEWTSALKLSTIWTCASIRAKAAAQCYTLMDKSCPISIVVLGKRYHIRKILSRLIRPQ